MARVAALLLTCFLSARGFNVDVAHPLVWHQQKDNFGCEVAFHKDIDGNYSLFVAALMTKATRNGRTSSETTWFQCSTSGNRACKLDHNFTRDDPGSSGPGFPLKTGGNATDRRTFEVEPQAAGSLKMLVYENGVSKKQVWSSEDLEPGSSYGQSWCVADLNGDGWDDLVVGEPLHSQGSTERGRMYVHVGQREGVFNTSIIIGKNSTRLLFGNSVSCVGDINLDGFQDIAVGAPGEPDGGAIYIYRGSEAGVDVQYSQRISAADVDREKGGIKGFGVSISEGADLDGNHYNDVAVGASQSRHAILLRARPVVHMQASLQADTSEISNLTTSFSLTYVINFTACHQQPPIEVEVVLQADSLQCATAAPSDTSCAGKPGGALYNQTRKLLQDNATSDTVRVALKRGIQLSPKPIEVKLNYKLVEDTTQDVSMLKPVVDPKDPKQKLLKINHTLSCGNRTCRTKLRIRAEIDNSTGAMVASQTTVRIKASVKNLGEPAYLSVVVVEAPVNLPLVGNTSLCFAGSTASTTHLQCHVGNPLTSADGPKILYFEMDLKKIPPSQDELRLSFSVTSVGEDNNHSDNSQVLEIRQSFRDSPSLAEHESRSLSSRHLIAAVVGSIIACGLLAAVVFYIVRQRSYSPWKRKVFYKKVVASEPLYSVPGATEEDENTYYVSFEDTATEPFKRRP